MMRAMCDPHRPQTDQARMSSTSDMTSLEVEQEWLSLVLQLLSVLFLCTILYNPAEPGLVGLARTMGGAALGQILAATFVDTLQRASITSTVRYLAKVILLGERVAVFRWTSRPNACPFCAHQSHHALLRQC
jgi:hypothetical protein